MIRKTAAASALLAALLLAGPVKSQGHQTPMGHRGPGTMEPGLFGTGIMGQMGPGMMDPEMTHHGMMDPRMMVWRSCGLGPMWI